MIIHSLPNLGSTGSDVIQYQLALKKKGFSVGTVDGIFGSKTRVATSDFQKSIGLPGSGIPGPQTLSALSLFVVLESPLGPSGRSPITIPLPGRKSSRHLHPTLRLLMEEKIFPANIVPADFSSKRIPEMVRATALGLESLHIREVGGNNRGEKVGFIQGIIGGSGKNGTGDAWCMSTDQCIIAFLEDFLLTESPCPDGENCMDVFRRGVQVNGLMSATCEPGSFFIAQHGRSSQGHTGTVLSILPAGKMRTFEGNTGDENARDGDGAYLRTRNQVKNGDLTTKGFMRLFPYNRLPSTDGVKK